MALRRLWRGASSAPGAAAPRVAVATRAIRQQIPPRPQVFVMCYIDHRARVVRDNKETDISLIRTRDLRFYLQRIMPDGEVIRWPVPGCEPMRHANSFETWSLYDVDLYGGVVIPSDVAPTNPYDPPSVVDAVMLMSNLKCTKKITRQTRRGWHRRVYATVEEEPLKYQVNLLVNSALAFSVLLAIGWRFNFCWKQGIGFFDYVSGAPVERRTDSLWDRARHFADEHVEQATQETIASQISPGMKQYSRMRAEARESDFTDPHYGTEFFWKVRHCAYYGHWPRGLSE